MFFLDISAACSDPALATILSTMRKIFNFVEIIAPIVLIVMVAVQMSLLMANPEDKKGLGKLKNSVFACVIIFFIPMLVNLVMGLMGEASTFSACWNSDPSTYDSSYIGNDSDNSPLFTDPNDYQNGESKTSNNKNNKTTNKNSNTNKNTTTSKSNSNTNKKSNSSTSRRDVSDNVKSVSTVFIGDSRTVQMYANLSNSWNNANYSSGGVHVIGNDIFVAESSMGLKWLKSTGIPAASEYFTKDRSIVILMGVNDLGNINNYIKYINDNSSSWTKNGSSLYFVSVNPCDGKYSNLNSSIETFNSRLKLDLSQNINFIDTYSILKSQGFSTTDGLHYEKSTYQVIYNYIKSNV